MQIWSLELLRACIHKRAAIAVSRPDGNVSTTVCYEHTDEEGGMELCKRWGRSPLSCDQEQDANRFKLLPLRAVVVSVAEGRDVIPLWCVSERLAKANRR
jgi:hypothetical protein